MENNLRNYWKSCLLGLLLFLAACKGNPLPSQDGTSWQHCKDASEKLIKMLQNYGIKIPAEATLSVSFPQRIECSDKCDPDSLNEDKTHCLQKITRGLHGYHDLLRLFSKSDSTADLQSVLQELLQLLPEEMD